VDALSQFFKLAIAVGFLVTTANAVRPAAVAERDRPDYQLLLGLSALGLMLLSSAVELMTIYVCLETASYSLYAVIALRSRDRSAAEAAIKYIMFGALATALSLYGYSYIIATQHTSYIAELATRDWSVTASPLAVLGLAMFLCGLLFKLAMFPFHFWCPDVYEGAGNETAAFAAVMPKLGAAAVLVRLAAMLAPGEALTDALALFGAVSMTLGNLAALTQKDIKRMLGYSSVAHAGYLMLGVVSGTAQGLAAAAFYSVVYLLMNLTCFWVVCRLSTDGRNLSYADLDGLYKRAPVLAFVLAVSAFALVGLPPTAGFMGKLFLLEAAWSQGYHWLVIVAVLNTAVAIYFYLGLARHAYTVETASQPDSGGAHGWEMTFGAALAVALLVLGAVPRPVYELALAAGNCLK